VTDKTEEADAVDARPAAAEEADNEQQRSNADKKRSHPVQRLIRRRVGAVSRAAGGRQ